MGAERSQWQFPANEVGKVIGWSDEASPSNPSASKGLVNKGPFVEPGDIANMVETTDTDASGFGFVNSTGPLADSDTTLPAESVVKAYVDDQVGGITHPVISPTTYGVVGDGTTDDATAFQACVTAAAGRVIWIDGLTIRIPSGSITVPSTGLHLAGKGKIVYEGTGTLFLGAQIDVTTYSHVATAGQTVFTDTDDYDGAYIEVFVNGVLKDPRTYTATHNTTDLTITFTSGATLNDDVDINVYRINDTTDTLAAFSRVIVGSGVQITTTQQNAGRAFALGWEDYGFLPGRQFPSFLMEAGAVIRGETGEDGFANAIWLSGFQNVQINGYIFGRGANEIPSGGQANNTQCDIGVLLTGRFTSSDVKFTGGMIGYYNRAVATYWGTVEGIQIANFTFLNVGLAVWWVGRSTDNGQYLSMIGCHVNGYNGTAYIYSTIDVYVADCDLFQNPLSTDAFFRFFELHGCNSSVIHGNNMRSFVTGGVNVVGVALDNGTKGVRVYGNNFFAPDTAATFLGMTCASGTSDNVIGPNTYHNGARALNAASGSLRIGALTKGDVWLGTAPSAAKYLMAGSHWWIDEKNLVLVSGAVSVTTATLTEITWTEGRDPESVYTSGDIVVPAWATRARIKGRFTFAANSTGVRMARVMNGGAETSCKTQIAAQVNGVGVISFDEEIAVAASDTLDAWVYQNSGADLNLTSAELRVRFF